MAEYKLPCGCTVPLIEGGQPMMDLVAMFSRYASIHGDGDWADGHKHASFSFKDKVERARRLLRETIERKKDPKKETGTTS